MTGIEEQLTKKRYWLWVLMSLLALASLCNLLLSITIIAVLRVNKGMESIEVMPEESLIKLYGRTDFDRINLENGVCEGYGDVPLEVTADGEGAGVSIRSRKDHLSDDNAPFSKLEIQPSGTKISHANSFEIKDPTTGETHFSTNYPNFGLPAGVKKIEVKIAESRRIVSPLNANLAISSDLGITVHGAEGTRIDAREILLASNDSDVLLRSTNGSVVLEGSHGILLNLTHVPVASVPKASIPPASASLPATATFVNSQSATWQYKLCVCMPQGKLFRVPLTRDNDHLDNCARIDRAPENDPCSY